MGNQLILESTKQLDKKAILIGLNYSGTRHSLKGCHNDIKRMSDLLSKRGYNDIKLLYDKNITNDYNVLEALDELIDSNKSELFFHYSGHGTQKTDYDGDELDKLDEILYTKNGVLISDDQIADKICKLKSHQKLIMVFDCCHSGTIVDLPYLYNSDAILVSDTGKTLTNGKVICISGCQDNQTSADVSSYGFLNFFSGKKGQVSYGAMSNGLQTVLNKHKNLTWEVLVLKLRVELKNKYSQVPQLTTSEKNLLHQKVGL